MKKVLTILLAAAVTLALFAAPAGAEFDPQTDKISPQHAIMIDAATGSVLYEKDANAKAYPASTTKIMTCILALELGDLDEEVTVGAEVWRGFGSQSSLMGLQEGERVTLRDLIYGTMLVSGNDAAAAIAVHIAGSISDFADLMNKKAAELGMTSTHFVTPHGKHDEDHYTTAADMARLARYATTQSPQAKNFRAVVKKETYHIDPTNRNKNGYDLENSNKLIHTKEDKENLEYRYATGIKTGDTNQAQRCLVASAEKDGTSLICVLMEDKENDTRFIVAQKLFDWGFANLQTVPAGELGITAEKETAVNNCSFSDAENGILVVKADLSDKTVTASKSVLNAIKADPSQVTMDVSFPDGGITAPVQEGDVVGTASFTCNGQLLFTADVIATRSVEPMAVSSSADPVDPQGQSADPALQVGEVQTQQRNVSWVFWVLVALVLLIIICLVLRIANARQTKRRRKRAVYRGRR